MSSSKQVVLLTGASRGLGLGVAKLLLSGNKTSGLASCKLVTLSRSHPAELQELEKQYGDDILCVQGDVTKEADNDKAVKAAKDKFGRLDAVVLNSGIAAFRRIADVPVEEVSKIFEVNLFSLYKTVRAAIPLLRESPSGVGKVVLVSSGAAVGNYAAWSAYSASKAAANAFIRALAKEEPKIAAFAVRPGVIDTDMQADLRANAGAHADKDVMQRFLDMHKNGELLKAEQPGHVLAALALGGTRDEPKNAEGEGLGSLGAFFNWNGDEVKGSQWQLSSQ